MRPVSIIILAWNRWPLTSRLLDSIARYTDLTNIRVIVVDNGSTDETPAGLKRYSWVHVLRHAENLGYVRGNNAAIRQTGDECDVVLLNNDIEILHREWLERLQQAAHASPHIGIAGCRLLLGSGRLLHAGTWIRADDCLGQEIGTNEVDLNQFAETRDVEGIVFACAYLRREVIRDIGLLSEDYESYFEDTDYCLRAVEKGYRIVCCGSVTMRHDEHGSTGNDEAFRHGVFERSRTVFRAKWSERLESRYFTSLTWQSVLNEPSAYSVSSRAIVQALDQQGVRVSYRFAHGRGTPHSLEEEQHSGDLLLELVRARREPVQPEIAVTFAHGDVFDRNQGRYRIGFTMLECSAFPPQWIRQASRMDEVWTPSEAGRRSMLAQGVMRPIYVIPLGVDRDRFHPRALRIPNHGGEFVFVTNIELSACERESLDLLLRTFNATFRRRERAILVCKINIRDPGIDVPDTLLTLGLDESGGRIHLIHNREVPHYQLASLYRSADCYVSITRGEGWGMPVAEAMACGLPVIAADYPSQSEILDDADSYRLRTGVTAAPPDGTHLAELLRHVYENREEASARGLRASARIRSTHSWNETARAIIERLRTLRL